MTMTYAIREGFSYERREEAGVQSPRRTLDQRREAAVNFAVLMMEAARAPRYGRTLCFRLCLCSPR